MNTHTLELADAIMTLAILIMMIVLLLRGRV